MKEADTRSSYRKFVLEEESDGKVEKCDKIRCIYATSNKLPWQGKGQALKK